MIILGISAFYHDAAATLLINGEIVAAAQEERFTRIKHDPSFPAHSIRFCLDFAHCTISDLDAVVFYEKPFLKFERLLETYYAFSPRGFASFIKAIPVWVKEKLFLKKTIITELNKSGKFNKEKTKLLFPSHHLSHAASAFYPSSFETAAILTIDGVGEWTTASVSIGKGKEITLLRELDFPHSLGLLYSAFTYYLGFTVNSGEYKLMGLAPYGNTGDEQTKEFISLIKSRLVTIADDGSIALNQEYFSYATSTRMVRDKDWQKLFQLARREPEEELLPAHCNLALAIQMVTEEIVLKMAAEAKRITGSDNLCMAGGVALNSVANGKIQSATLFRNIFIQPAAGDAGGALGAALAAYHIYFDKERNIQPETDGMKGALLGPQYAQEQIRDLQTKFGVVYKTFLQEEELLQIIARSLAEGKIVGWHQGRMEFGPRALGSRSILADAGNPEMQKKLNLEIKFREGFRPFAPVVQKESAAEYFDLAGTSPYMLLVKKVNSKYLLPLPDDFSRMDIRQKLATKRSILPAITHVDLSARIQTVAADVNPRFWSLLEAFKQITGVPVLINTSMNVRGEPMVNTPEEAYRCFMHTGMDLLVIGDSVFEKNEQPESPQWKTKNRFEGKD